MENSFHSRTPKPQFLSSLRCMWLPWFVYISMHLIWFEIPSSISGYHLTYSSVMRWWKISDVMEVGNFWHYPIIQWDDEMWVKWKNLNWDVSIIKCNSRVLRNDYAWWVDLLGKNPKNNFLNYHIERFGGKKFVNFFARAVTATGVVEISYHYPKKASLIFADNL